MSLDYLMKLNKQNIIDSASRQTQASDLLRIDVSKLPTGVYFVKIVNKIEKFVKDVVCSNLPKVLNLRKAGLLAVSGKFMSTIPTAC